VHAGSVEALLGIGDFSRMTFLSVKTLHRHHEIGLLPPAEIDRESGYRRYALAGPDRPGDPAAARGTSPVCGKMPHGRVHYRVRYSLADVRGWSECADELCLWIGGLEWSRERQLGQALPKRSISGPSMSGLK
jgi:hypothetical protein